MKYVIIAVLALCACDEPEVDKPSVVAAKAECKQLFAHIVQITPQTKDQKPEDVVAKISIEDLQTCASSPIEIRECMMGAPDVAGVKKCIPSEDVLGCMTKANKARAKAREDKKVDDVDPTVDAPFDAIRKKCYACDAKAADDLKVD
ncbi:MAG TPA: hypothetical protein VIV58_36090 [Kofleriaceae bacterium]